jgi:hypothetical protein
MSMQEILSEINRLPLQDRLLIIEKTLEVIRANESDQQLSAASDMMEAEYRSNKELTAFASLDLEDFYEGR